MNQKFPVMVGILICFNFFAGGCDNSNNPKGDIFKAVKKEDVKTVKTLLERNPDLINSKDNYGVTPIYYGNDQMILLLLSYKANINTTNNDGVTPLLAAT